MISFCELPKIGMIFIVYNAIKFKHSKMLVEGGGAES